MTSVQSPPPLPPRGNPVCISALVVGAGVAGMLAALELWRQGIDVQIIERAPSRLTGAKMAPEITLYTAHHCPFAHRAQIALRELGLEFETFLVDITVPRTPEYLAINPRGLVPALVYNGHVLTESGLIVQFLLDSHHPTHLLKSSSEPDGALQRYNIGFFVDTYFSKVHTFFDKAIYSTLAEETTAAANEYIEAVVKDVEPILEDAAPFFGGSSRLTLAEVQTGSFLLRVLTLPKYEEILPQFILESLQTKAPNFWKWANAVIAEKSVTAVWDEDDVVKRTIARIKK